jgi:hypothetical protein
MTTHIAPNQVRLLKIRRHLTLALLAAIAVTYSAVAATSTSSTVDQVIADGEMELAVHWHGNTPHYHVVAAGELNALAQQPNQVAAFRAPNVAFTTGTHRALVINLVRADGLVAPRDVVNARYLEGAAGMHAMSRGMLTISVDLFGRDVAVPYGADICDRYSDFTQPVLDEVRREISTVGYRFISFVLPVHTTEAFTTGGCRFGGLGQVNGALTWNVAYIDWPESRPSTKVVMHEWGHNLGLWHSNYLQCAVGAQPVALAARADRAAGACKRHEYGGEWSVMGSARSSSITAGERRHLGWLRDGEQTSVSEGIVTLGFDGPVSLVWLQNAEGDLFQVEFVKPTEGNSCKRDYNGYWTYLCDSPTHTGVLVKFVERAESSDTDYVLDTAPQTGVLADAPLKAMQSWTDATGSVMVTVLSITDNSATVQLKGIAVAPSAVNVTKVTPRAAIGSVDLAWEAAPSTLRVVRYEVLIYEGAEQREVQIVNAEGLRNALQIPNATRRSDYWVAVRAINELGVAGPASAVAPVRWDNSKKPGTGNGGVKPCTGKSPSKRCK